MKCTKSGTKVASLAPIYRVFAYMIKIKQQYYLASSLRIDQGCPAQLPSMEIIFFVY